MSSVGEGAGTVTLRAVAVTTANTAPAADFSFDATVVTANGSAAQPADYAELSTSVTFVASDFSQADVNGAQRYRAVKEFVLAIADDALDEPDETFTATLAYTTPGLPHLRGGLSTATVTITDDDHVPVTIAWERAASTVAEGAGTVTLNAFVVTTKDKVPDSGFSLDVSVSTSQGVAVETDDYVGLSQTVTFTRSAFRRSTVDGQRRYRAVGQIRVTIDDDDDDEPDESFTVTLAYANPGLPHLQGGPSTASVTITDNDHVPVTIAFEETAFTVDEDVGTVTLRAVAVTTKDKMPESGFSFGVSVSTAEGTAAQTEDYRRLNTTESFRRSDFERATVNGQQRYRAVRGGHGAHSGRHRRRTGRGLHRKRGVHEPRSPVPPGRAGCRGDKHHRQRPRARGPRLGADGVHRGGGERRHPQGRCRDYERQDAGERLLFRRHRVDRQRQRPAAGRLRAALRDRDLRPERLQPDDCQRTAALHGRRRSSPCPSRATTSAKPTSTSP